MKTTAKSDSTSIPPVGILLSRPHVGALTFSRATSPPHPSPALNTRANRPPLQAKRRPAQCSQLAALAPFRGSFCPSGEAFGAAHGWSFVDIQAVFCILIDFCVRGSAEGRFAHAQASFALLRLEKWQLVADFSRSTGPPPFQTPKPQPSACRGQPSLSCGRSLKSESHKVIKS
jgi:hypothetical protein